MVYRAETAARLHGSVSCCLVAVFSGLGSTDLLENGKSPVYIMWLLSQKRIMRHLGPFGLKKENNHYACSNCPVDVHKVVVAQPAIQSFEPAFTEVCSVYYANTDDETGII